MQTRVDFQTKCWFSTIKFSKSPINALWKYWNIFICDEIEGISTAIFLASFWYLITLSKESTKSLSLPPIKTSFILIINLQSNICPYLPLHQNKIALLCNKSRQSLFCFSYSTTREARFRKFLSDFRGWSLPNVIMRMVHLSTQPGIPLILLTLASQTIKSRDIVLKSHSD